jgi:hypothetical protein
MTLTGKFLATTGSMELLGVSFRSSEVRYIGPGSQNRPGCTGAVLPPVRPDDIGRHASFLS